VGHVDVASSGPEALYFCVLGLESCHQVVDAVLGFGELLGSNGCPPFDGGGEAEGHHAGDLAEFLLAEADEGLGRAGGERGVWVVWQINADMERWWGDVLD